MMHTMKPTGRDIYPISYYETSEWQMSVDNAGMIVYTRWDYTDRDDCLGSHFWICYPDGRDPRAPHGNYPYPWHTFADNTHGDHNRGGGCPCAKSGLPKTEMGIRAIPGSSKYMLVAAPHHGESFGSLCRLDIEVKDDNEMSQLRRMTPYVAFPESESAARSQYQYGTPWPLDANLYLCNRWEDIVLRDRFGNEELVCARESLPCGYDPRTRLTHVRPFGPRKRPPVIPQQTAQGEDRRHLKRPAVISVVDVRQSDIPFPTNRVPTRLRVLQAIVKPDPWMDRPFIGCRSRTTAAATSRRRPASSSSSRCWTRTARRSRRCARRRSCIRASTFPARDATSRSRRRSRVRRSARRRCRVRPRSWSRRESAWSRSPTRGW